MSVFLLISSAFPPLTDIIRVGQYVRSWPITDIAGTLAKERADLLSKLAAAETRLAELRTILDGASESPVDLSERIASETTKIVEPLLDRLDAVAPEDRRVLVEIAGDAALRGSGVLSADAYRLILKHFPLWAVTTLAAGSRIPVVAGLFDYVIFDEAAQTDIASATQGYTRRRPRAIELVFVASS